MNNRIEQVFITISTVISIICIKLPMKILSEGQKIDDPIVFYFFCIGTPILLWVSYCHWSSKHEATKESKPKNNSNDNVICLSDKTKDTLSNTSVNSVNNPIKSSNSTIEEISNKLSELATKEDFENVMIYSNKAIEMYPNEPYFYFCRASASIKIYGLENLTPFITDIKKILEIDPKYECVGDLLGLVFAYMFIVGSYGSDFSNDDATYKLINSYENLYNELPREAFGLLNQLFEDRDDYIKDTADTCNKIIEKFPDKFYFPYAILAYIDIRSIDLETEENNFCADKIKTNIDKAIKINPNAIFNKIIRFLYSTLVFGTLLSSDKLPIIDIDSINEIHEDHKILKDIGITALEFPSIELYELKSNTYAKAVIEKIPIILALLKTKTVEAMDRKILIEYLEKYSNQSEFSDLTKLEKYADISIAFKPDNSIAYVAKATSKMLLGEKDGVISMIDKALQIDPDNKIAHIILSLTYALNKDYQKAATILRDFISKNKDIEELGFEKDTLEILEKKLSQQKIIDSQLNENNGRELDI